MILAHVLAPETRTAAGQETGGTCPSPLPRTIIAPCRFLGDPRRRSIVPARGGVAAVVRFCWARCRRSTCLEFGFSNPETSGETLAFVGLIVLVFLLLMLLLTLLFRNILKLYADQSGSALGARLRTRMVVGAAMIALIPAVCMFLFSFLLMNRSLDSVVLAADIGTARRFDARGPGAGAVRDGQCAG